MSKPTLKDKRANGINKVREKNAAGAKKIGERMIENYKSAPKPTIPKKKK